MAAPIYLSPPACLGHRAGDDHPEAPGRLTAIEEALGRRGWCGYRRRDAPPVAPDALAAIHTAAHIRAVREGGVLDGGDTIAGPGSFDAAARAAGAACELARALMSGEAPTGFCAVRPPGHHAGAGTTSGFCLFNSVAIAARSAIDDLGARRVMIIDWDVHHGDGTQALFADRSDVLYASIHQSGIYPGSGPLTYEGVGDGIGHTVNLPVPAGSGADVWLSMIEWIVAPVGEEYAPDLILISAGFDAHRDDPLADCLLDAGDFAEMARHVRDLGERVGAPVGAVLEGGYHPHALADSVVATMGALAGDRPAHSAAPHFLTGRAASQVGHRWRL
jgi:acetoin utilization deacetylase AcuC-like enzyme